MAERYKIVREVYVRICEAFMRIALLLGIADSSLRPVAPVSIAAPARNRTEFGPVRKGSNHR